MNTGGSGSNLLDCCPRAGEQVVAQWQREAMAQILRHRKRLKLSQAELAERAGIGRSMLSQLETGKKPVGADTLERLASALGCRVEVKIKRGK